jgi:Type IV pili methyl-accepting chemotaxis transducer N-term
MYRRTFLVLGATQAIPARAAISDLPEAINQAGRQRMLSQRMSKAWLAVALGVETSQSQKILGASVELFERQLADLKAFAPNANIRGTYQQLGSAWMDFKALLTRAKPDPVHTPSILEADATVLALAHSGTQAYEAALQLPVGQLVNLAGRQRMLSQRMAKFYLAATASADAKQAVQEIQGARSEFVTALGVLRQAPQATPRIHEELQLAEAQWLFFDHALRRIHQSQPGTRHAQDVLVTSENILSVMERVTGLYTSLKT